jgi:hypothetical protein
MASPASIPIPTPLVEFILLGPLDDRRQLQDSPILGDVWVEFGKKPAEPIDLLISPFRGKHASEVAELLDKDLEKSDHADVAFLQGLVVARLTFFELLRFVLPKTKWWIDKRKDYQRRLATASTAGQTGGTPTAQPTGAGKEPVRDIADVGSITALKNTLEPIVNLAKAWNSETESKQDIQIQDLPPFQRFVTLSLMILWAADPGSTKKAKKDATVKQQISHILDQVSVPAVWQKLAAQMLADQTPEELVYQVSLNRSAMPALSKSIASVKADAVSTLFKTSCKDIGWAVLDSGIAGTHPAFGGGKANGSRIKRSFDFKHFRRIVSLGNSRKQVRQRNLDEILEDAGNLKTATDLATADKALEELATDLKSHRPIHWELVQQFVEIRTDSTPRTNHGTHVAGIIGANKNAAQVAAEQAGQPEVSDLADGMCPDITLYDFRVLGPNLRDTEFAIIAAMQFIRYLNSRDNRFLAIHGANLSLSIPHDVRNYACGSTPICEECERLVGSGVVVVAAAGNHGYKSFQTADGSYDSYAAFSITDPGNADGVITVGSTHRFWPHTYGVSFFSSRGPTGDGRLKPDLVAPGERIRAPIPSAPGINVPGGEWGDLDGTSMAAPHVSGAAALLMARYSELIGRPRRIKQILCDSATDLGRERSFQGHGMLDVLRAFQSI